VSPFIPALKSYAVAVVVSSNPGAKLRAPNQDAVQIHVVKVASHRVQQRRVPQPPAIVADRIKSFSLPERAQNPDRVRHDHISRDCLLRKSSSAISGFRSLCGREQHSPSYCARLDLRFGTFHSAGSRFENSGLHPLLPTGPATLDRCCGRNV